jgi:uncharacterized protein YkwD
MRKTDALAGPWILVLVFLGVVGVLGWTEKCQALDLHAIEHRIVEETNQERVLMGLHPLKIDDSLVASARVHCYWMTSTETFRHTTQPVGENIALGQESVREVVRDWMNSPGHRANILHQGYRRIGVAAFARPGGRIYWVQQFLH